MALLKDTRTWTITDPLQHDDFETSRGTLKVSPGGHAMIHDEQLAKEIEEREPWALVTEHEPFRGTGLRGQSMMVVPELPWKKEKREQEDEKENAQVHESHDG